jgi:hypothetical protein
MVSKVLPAIALLVGSSLPLAGIFAQQRPATISGVVTAVGTGEPLLGVQVVVTGTKIWTLTNADGVFQLRNVPPGKHIVEVKHPNRAPLAFPVTLEPGQNMELAVRLETAAVPLPELVVEGEAEPVPPKMIGFHTRKGSGQGYFITREDIEKRNPRVLSDMLRSVPGLRITCNGGHCTVRSFTETRRIMGGCPIQYFLDGLPFMGDVDELTPDQVEGIEVYRGSASIPPEFNTGTAMCGVIALWSRVPG